MNYTGKIISLAFPDTFVKHSDESSTKVLLALGLGKNDYIKAGHAALVLIKNNTGEAAYYDFGRYITPKGKGRVRSAITDVELKIPFRAHFNAKGELDNLEEFLLWLEAHPEKTHGNGRLVASVCDHIYYDKASDFILNMQSRGSILYQAFGKEGSNCSRIVTDTILAGTDHQKIIKGLVRNKKFTPSPLGNVEKASLGSPMFQVENGKIKLYSRSVVKENMINYFDKNIPIIEKKKTSELPGFLNEAHFLSGIGSSAYFTIKKSIEEPFMEISRYTESGVQDFRGLFRTKQDFDIDKKHEFIYDSHCKYCHVAQDGNTVRFDLVRSILPVK